MLKRKNRGNIEVSSAGLLDMHGAAGDPPAVDMLVKNGFDGSDHRSRLLTETLIDEADKVIVMEQSHRTSIMEKFPGREGKIHLLKSFSPFASPTTDLDIRDAHKKSNYHLRVCFAEIYESIEGLMKCI